MSCAQNPNTEEQEAQEALFNRYKKVDGKTEVLLLYLILNNYDLEKVEKVVEVVQSEKSGLEFRRMYGETTEFVDVKAIEAELNAIRTPLVCSLQSYEMNSSAETIHAYRAKIPEKPLYINDMGVISPLMVITEDCIVSSNMAVPVENSKKTGFMYFVDYVLRGECRVGNWYITYKENTLRVYYCTQRDNEEQQAATRTSACPQSGQCVQSQTSREHDVRDQERQEMLYQATGLDQTSSYKLVLYIINKVSAGMNEFSPDNFVEETWRLEKEI